jgi:hypothetical protein
VVLEADKAGHDGKQYRSYGTARADGILALLALGRQDQNERVRAARRWLKMHHQVTEVPGFEGEAYRRWRTGL